MGFGFLTFFWQLVYGFENLEFLYNIFQMAASSIAYLGIPFVILTVGIIIRVFGKNKPPKWQNSLEQAGKNRGIGKSSKGLWFPNLFWFMRWQ